MRHAHIPLEELSPLVLKDRIERIRNKIAKLERGRARAREQDQKAQADSEREVAKAKGRLDDVQARLKDVRESMRILKKDPSNSHMRFSLWATLTGQAAGSGLTDDARRKMSALQAELDSHLDEEYACEVAAGMVEHPQYVMQRIAFEGTNLYDRLHDPRKPKLPEKFVRYKLRIGKLRFEPDPPRRFPCLERRLDEEIKPLVGELASLEKALGEHDSKLTELEAWKAQALKQTRELARRLRMSFLPTDECPYCGKAVGNEPRLDHIYPVSKGGLSVRSNLVFVCLDCNQRKSDMTLAAFVKTYRLDRERIEARLAGFGKDF